MRIQNLQSLNHIPLEKRCVSRRKKMIFLLIFLLFLCVGITAVLFYTGVLLFNQPSEEKYPVRGVDVSSYQGKIDWTELSQQKIDFAFIKATEGSSSIDPTFAYNWEKVFSCGLRAGAYHFFSYDSSGMTQAENYISTVQKKEKMLPPVVDVEFYGDKEKNPPDKETVKTELSDMLKSLEEYYGMQPILYATEKSYALFLAGNFEEYDIWIRNVFTTPALSDGRSWTFWQYTNRARLAGYAGKELYIDLNVFAGSYEEFLKYPQK